MDNLTHTAAGWLLSRVGLNRLTPHCTAVLLLAANAPDGDIVTLAFGSPFYFEQHRLWTHTWLFLPLLALLPVLIVWLFARKTLRLGPAYLASLVGVASHILLDWCNGYPTRFAMPFSDHRFHLDLLFIIDPWMLAAMVLALLAPYLARLVSDEIGARRGSGRGLAITGLIVVLLWIAGHAALHSRVLGELEPRMYGAESPIRLGAYPTVNPFAWDTVVETPLAFYRQRVLLTREFDPEAGQVYFKPPLTPALVKARAAEPFRFMQYFAEFPLWRLTPVPQGMRVDLIDLRFGTPRDAIFRSSAIVTPQGQVEAEASSYR